jgi:hypothetical protein
MLGITTTVLTTEHHQWLNKKRCHGKSKYKQSDKTKKARKNKIKDKLREASELLMKDKKEGKTYGRYMAGPQVEGMTLDGSVVVKKINQERRRRVHYRKRQHAIHAILWDMLFKTTRIVC